MYEKSYHAKVIKKDSAQVRRERARSRRRRIIITAGSVLLVVLFIVIIRLPVLQVKTIEVTGTEVVDPVDVQHFLLNELSGNYLYFFPKTSILLVSLPKLEARMQSNFPRLASVHIDRSSTTALTVLVTEYHAQYLWCTTTECFLMDQNGMVYSKAPYFSGVTYPKIFIGEAKPLPFTPLAPNDLATLQLFTTRLAAIGLVLEEFHFETPHTLRIIFVHHGDLATLFVDPTLDGNVTLENFYSSIHTEPLATPFMNASKKLDYIDMRYGERVVYKFQ